MSMPLRVLVTKVGFDGHDRGSRLVSSFLRDAGHEVIYTAPWQEIEAVVRLAVDEDVDIIGISTLATDHLIVPDLMAALVAAGKGDVAVVVGGIVPEQERPALIAAGVRAIFGPGSSRDEIIQAIERIGDDVREARDRVLVGEA
jgi:methylmalonyl-CoA mutase C-terminal domain/subunit